MSEPARRSATRVSQGLLALSFGAVLAVVAGAAPSQAQNASAALTSKAVDAAQMMSLAADSGAVRVIVTFASPVVPSSLEATPEAADAAKAQVQSGQDAILADHFGSATALPANLAVNRMLVSPMFAITVTAAQLDELANDPRVTKIVIDGQNKSQLIQTVPQIGMTGGGGAYAQGGTGLGYGVAIIDTGVQATHVFLSGGKVTVQHCFSTIDAVSGYSSLCPNGLTEDTSADPTVAACLKGAAEMCEHGTHVAGIAGGYYNGVAPAGIPTNGVAYAAALIGIQVFTRGNNATACGGGSAPCITAFDSDIEKALEWLYYYELTLPGAQRLAAVNMSLGGSTLYTGTCDSAVEKTGIDLLRSMGVATTVSAGNDSSTNGISSPACISTAIAVASVDKTDVISSFSDISSQVAVFAPGGDGLGGVGDVLSSVASQLSNTTFKYFAGTSMAAPHVAGAIAAIRSACPGNIPFNSDGLDAIISALKSTGILIFDSRVGGTFTKPRIRVDQAIPVACSYSPPSTVVAIDPLTIGGLSALAVIGLGFGFWRRRTA